MGLFSSPSRPQVPSIDDEEVAEQRARTRRAAAAARGRSATLLTGAQGVGTSPTARPSLVGGPSAA